MTTLIQRIPSGITLLLIAPVLGELVSAHQTPLEFINPLNFLVLSLPYGFGALVVRELVVRWGKGWSSMIILGLAYGVYEEALVVYSVFDPLWKELGPLSHYGRSIGINWTWAAMTIHFHTLISICSSIIITELLYPSRRGQPWLTRKYFYLCLAGLISWIPVMGFIMINYTGRVFPPISYYCLAIITVTLLVWIAYRLPKHLFRVVVRSVPSPLLFFLIGLINMSIFFVSVFLTADNNFPPLFYTILFLIVLEVITLWAINYFSGRGYCWDDRHVLALVSGFLGFFICFCFTKDVEYWTGRSIVGIFTIIGLGVLYRFVRNKVKLNPHGR
jgi:hypothetical protein